MIQTNVFDYIRLLDKAADASWLRNEVLSNNLANIDTPGFKRQDVDFESVLKEALGLNLNGSYEDMDHRVAGLRHKDLSARIYTDHSNFSYRIDGNNVDVDNENVMLAENQLRYQGLITSINQEFANLKEAMQ